MPRALSLAVLLALPARLDAACTSIDHAHAAWSGILARHVRAARVDYAGWKAAGTGPLDAYLAVLSGACRADYARWAESERLAFWINAYNAFTVKLVLEHYPTPSIRRIFLLRSPFAYPFIPMPELRGGTISLDTIEHEMLRRDFREPRIHFAIVCASIGCPPLRGEAYRAADLEGQLDEQARTFLGDRTKNRWAPTEGTLYLSSIFRWFREDFERAAGSLPAFVARYVDPATAAAIGRGDVRVAFLDYDWSLNAQ